MATTVKEYLQQYRKAADAEQLALLDLAETRALLGSTRSALNNIDSIRGTADEAFLSRDIERQEALERRLLAKIHKCRRWQARVRRTVNRVEPAGFRKILKMRYILGMSWEGIAGSLHMDERYVYKLHGKALQYLEREKPGRTITEAPKP